MAGKVNRVLIFGSNRSQGSHRPDAPAVPARVRSTLFATRVVAAFARRNPHSEVQSGRSFTMASLTVG